MAAFNFDATNIQPGGSFEVLPAGEYVVILTSSDMKPTKANDGQYMEIQMEVIDGPHKGATIYDRLNVINNNPKAVEIAQRALSAICHAVGVISFRDTAELHNRPLLAKIKYVDAVIQNGQQIYGAKNEVQRYKAIGAQQPQAAHQQQPIPQAAPAQAQAPWGAQPQAAPAQAPWGAQPQQQAPQQPAQPLAPPWASQAA